MGESQSITTISDGPTGRLPDLQLARSPHSVIALRERRLDRLAGDAQAIAVITQPDRVEISRTAQIYAGPVVAEPAMAEASEPSTDRKAYAVAPIAAVNERPELPPPPLQMVVHLDSVFQVTNLGSLMDVLA